MDIEDSEEYPVEEKVVHQIKGALEVVEFMGYWPSFRDTEVIRLSFDRLHDKSIYNDLSAEFFIFDLSVGYRSPQGKQAYLELLFRGLDRLRVEGWAHQNPIRGMSLMQINGEKESSYSRFSVSWGGCGHEVSFCCQSISVLRLRDANPYEESWKWKYDP